MSDDTFTDPDDAVRSEGPDSADAATTPDGPATGDHRWADVRMTDPQEGEWNVDAVVVDGHVEYVDLQVRTDLLDDVSAERAGRILANVAASRGLDVPSGARDE